MAAIQLNNGKWLTTGPGMGDLSDDQFNAVADVVEKSGAVPRGFTLQEQAPPPTDTRGLTERFGSAVQTGLDYATKGVEKAVDLSLTGDPLMSEKGRAEAPGMVAKGFIPQTPQDLLTTMALGAASKIPGMGGVLTRLGVTVGGDVGGRLATGQEQNPKETLLKTGVVGGMEVGGMIYPHLSQKILSVQKEAQGRRDTSALGQAFAKHTSLQNLDTPEAVAQSVAAPKFIQTPLSKSVSATMDANEKALMGGVRQVMGTTSPQNLQAATTILEKSADVTPKNPLGFRGPNAPVIQQQMTPDKLVEVSIDRLRHIREDINHAVDAAGTTGTVGVSTFDLYQKYDEIKDMLLAGLSTLDPSLKKAYQEMNSQYIKDIDLAQFLYKGKDTFTTGLHGAKLDTPAFGEYVAKSVEGIRDKNLVADILKVTNRGGEFGAADQGWTFGPRIGGPRTQAGTVAQSIPVQGVTPARPIQTQENMPPMGVYDIGALKGLDLALPQEKRK